MCQLTNEGGITWSSVRRAQCVVTGRVHSSHSSMVGTRGACAHCGDCVFLDYGANETLYVASLPDETTIADADIFCRDASNATSDRVFEGMPLGKMGYIVDVGAWSIAR